MNVQAKNSRSVDQRTELQLASSCIANCDRVRRLGYPHALLQGHELLYICYWTFAEHTFESPGAEQHPLRCRRPTPQNHGDHPCRWISCRRGKLLCSSPHRLCLRPGQRSRAAPTCAPGPGQLARSALFVCRSNEARFLPDSPSCKQLIPVRATPCRWLPHPYRLGSRHIRFCCAVRVWVSATRSG